MVCDRLCCKRATSTAFEAALRIRTLLDFARSNRPESLSRRCWNLSAVGGCGRSLTETPYLRSLKAGRQDYRTSTTRGNCSLRMPRHRTNMRPSTLPPKSCGAFNRGVTGRATVQRCSNQDFGEAWRYIASERSCRWRYQRLCRRWPTTSFSTVALTRSIRL